jgi:hypothetical protein
MISVILTKYKRTHLFKEQLESIKNQSVDVDEILICDNSIDNKGVWERFDVAKKAKNEFVCIIDDDTIPGLLWIENCFSEFNKQEGLYGTRGMKFHSNKQYQGNYEEIGWCNPNKKTTQVDFVTHSWFFKKEWLDFFWRVNSVPHNYGEDMNLSFQLQKEGINTYVPLHPPTIKSLWGSTKGIDYGNDKNGLWTTNPDNFKSNMFKYFDKQINEGWKLINEPTLI